VDFAADVMPLKCFSTRKMVSFFSSPALAKTVKKSATGAEVIQVFWPLMT
jgi:hypothetical protein